MAGKGKVAVAIVHGIGEQDIGFEERVKNKIHDLCRDACGDDVEEQIIVEGVAWGPVLTKRQQMLHEALGIDEMRGIEGALREFMVNFAADAVAYNETGGWVYKGVHTTFAMALHRLALKTARNAPLCVIAHSLGTVISSNFIYDLQQDDPYGSNPNIPQAARFHMEKHLTPLERGQTINLLYTLGSPLALWTLLHRQNNFGKPIAIPPPLKMYDDERIPTGWYNIYDRDDIIAFPLEPLYPPKSDAYGEPERVVVRDMQANVGGFITSRTVASHMHYWDDDDVVRPIAEKLIETVQAVDNGHITLERIPAIEE